MIGDRAGFVEAVRQALYASKIVSYAQGFVQLQAASAEHDWGLDYGECSVAVARRLHHSSTVPGSHQGSLRRPIRTWRTCCWIPSLIRRSRRLRSRGERSSRRPRSLGIPVPAFSTALCYYDGYRLARLPANLLQAQRDYFGAHTYQRTDMPGTFHTEWLHLRKQPASPKRSRTCCRPDCWDRLNCEVDMASARGWARRCQLVRSCWFGTAPVSRLRQHAQVTQECIADAWIMVGVGDRQHLLQGLAKSPHRDSGLGGDSGSICSARCLASLPLGVVPRSELLMAAITITSLASLPIAAACSRIACAIRPATSTGARGCRLGHRRQRLRINVSALTAAIGRLEFMLECFFLRHPPTRSDPSATECSRRTRALHGSA